MPAPKDPIKYEEWKRKLSESHKNISEETREKMRISSSKRIASIETRKKISEGNKGKKRTPEQIERYKTCRPGFKQSEETKQKLSEIQRRPDNPRRGIPKTEEAKQKSREKMKGRKFTEEHKKKLREWQLGKKLPEEHKQKISKALKGKHCAESASGWKGGISFEPYCPKFNRAFKERVRAYFNYTCVECGNKENGMKHTPHHINYDKMVCCNTVKPLFILLCNPCNSKANFNRPQWEEYFTNMIEGYYEGKCYFTPEEMKQWEGI